MRPKLVIFDCDGVLVDSEGPMAEVLSANLTRHGLPVSPGDVHRLFVGGTLDSVGERSRALGARLPDSWVADAYVEIYARLREGVPPIPGVFDLIADLDRARIARWVASNGTMEKMRITLTPNGLWDLFEGRILSREGRRPKPAPDMILAALEAEGLGPEDAVMIDDSVPGCTSARNAGVRCLGFAAASDAEALAATGAEVVWSMAEARELLLGAGEDVAG
jgi:HAD superfamily hydrolase (TIGR01509 family)